MSAREYHGPEKHGESKVALDRCRAQAPDSDVRCEKPMGHDREHQCGPAHWQDDPPSGREHWWDDWDRPLRPWEQRFSDEEIAEMLRRGACMCGIEAAERNKYDSRTVIVPASASCEAHRSLSMRDAENV